MTVKHLGDLGVANAAPDLTFGWFGATIRTNPDGSPELELIEFMQNAAQIELGEVDPDHVTEEDLAQASGAMETILDFLKQQIHVDDWAEFWRLAKANRQSIADLFTVAKSLSEAASAFPSGRPSASSAGRSPTKVRQRAGSSSRGTRGHLSAVNHPLLEGRPDLQAAVVRAQEGRTQDGLRASG